MGHLEICQDLEISYHFDRSSINGRLHCLAVTTRHILRIDRNHDEPFHLRFYAVCAVNPRRRSNWLTSATRPTAQKMLQDSAITAKGIAQHSPSMARAAVMSKPWNISCMTRSRSLALASLFLLLS